MDRLRSVFTIVVGFLLGPVRLYMLGLNFCCFRPDEIRALKDGRGKTALLLERLAKSAIYAIDIRSVLR